ncbi:MAG TPA: DUF1992 domain-containing protein [Trebonia sp.]|jgi:hypothetical protein
MTERKPPQMKFATWIDQQVADAERRGVFDDLPGAGKPLKLKPGAVDGDYGAQWARDYAQREGVSVEEMLPTPLRLRRQIERLAQTAGEFRTEAEVREAAAELNRRIVEWRRIPIGPPIHVSLVNPDNLVATWRKAQAARAAAPPPAERPAATDSTGKAQAQPRRPRRWRSFWRRNRPDPALSGVVSARMWSEQHPITLAI